MGYKMYVCVFLYITLMSERVCNSVKISQPVASDLGTPSPQVQSHSAGGRKLLTKTAGM